MGIDRMFITIKTSKTNKAVSAEQEKLSCRELPINSKLGFNSAFL